MIQLTIDIQQLELATAIDPSLFQTADVNLILRSTAFNQVKEVTIQRRHSNQRIDRTILFEAYPHEELDMKTYLKSNRLSFELFQVFYTVPHHLFSTIAEPRYPMNLEDVRSKYRITQEPVINNSQHAEFLLGRCSVSLHELNNDRPARQTTVYLSERSDKFPFHFTSTPSLTVRMSLVAPRVVETPKPVTTTVSIQTENQPTKETRKPKRMIKHRKVLAKLNKPVTPVKSPGKVVKKRLVPFQRMVKAKQEIGTSPLKQKRSPKQPNIKSDPRTKSKEHSVVTRQEYHYFHHHYHYHNDTLSQKVNQIKLEREEVKQRAISRERSVDDQIVPDSLVEKGHTTRRPFQFEARPTEIQKLESIQYESKPSTRTTFEQLIRSNRFTIYEPENVVDPEPPRSIPRTILDTRGKLYGNYLDYLQGNFAL